MLGMIIRRQDGLLQFFKLIASFLWIRVLSLASFEPFCFSLSFGWQKQLWLFNLKPHNDSLGSCSTHSKQTAAPGFTGMYSGCNKWASHVALSSLPCGKPGGSVSTECSNETCSDLWSRLTFQADGHWTCFWISNKFVGRRSRWQILQAVVVCVS